MPALVPVRLRPVAVTVFPVPKFLSAKVAVPPVRLTSSVPITPVSVRVRIVAAVVPSYTLLSAVICGSTVALFTANVAEFEVPPPGAGVTTVMLNDPGVVKSLAGMLAVNCVALTNDVVRALPLKLTTEFKTKFAPVTVIVKPESP